MKQRLRHKQFDTKLKQTMYTYMRNCTYVLLSFILSGALSSCLPENVRQRGVNTGGNANGIGGNALGSNAKYSTTTPPAGPRTDDDNTNKIPNKGFKIAAQKEPLWAIECKKYTYGDPKVKYYARNNDGSFVTDTHIITEESFFVKHPITIAKDQNGNLQYETLKNAEGKNIGADGKVLEKDDSPIADKSKPIPSRVLVNPKGTSPDDDWDGDGISNVCEQIMQMNPECAHGYLSTLFEVNLQTLMKTAVKGALLKSESGNANSAQWEEIHTLWKSHVDSYIASPDTTDPIHVYSNDKTKNKKKYAKKSWNKKLKDQKPKGKLAKKIDNALFNNRRLNEPRNPEEFWLGNAFCAYSNLQQTGKSYSDASTILKTIFETHAYMQDDDVTKNQSVKEVELNFALNNFVNKNALINDPFAYIKGGFDEALTHNPFTYKSLHKITGMLNTYDNDKADQKLVYLAESYLNPKHDIDVHLMHLNKLGSDANFTSNDPREAALAVVGGNTIINSINFGVQNGKRSSLAPDFVKEAFADCFKKEVTKGTIAASPNQKVPFVYAAFFLGQDRNFFRENIFMQYDQQDKKKLHFPLQEISTIYNQPYDADSQIDYTSINASLPEDGSLGHVQGKCHLTDAAYWSLYNSKSPALSGIQTYPIDDTAGKLEYNFNPDNDIVDP